MRISDWSSDVCSSDLHQPGADGSHQETDRENARGAPQLSGAVFAGEEMLGEIEGEGRIGIPVIPFHQIAGGTADDRLQALALIGWRDRKSVGKGRSVSVRVDPGGSRYIKKKNN